MTETLPSIANGRSGAGAPSPKGMRRLAVVALAGMALALAACSSSSSPASSTASTTMSSGSTSASTSGSGSGKSGGADAITIQNFAFSPADLTVAPGATVTVTNKDQVTHTLTATKGVFNTGDIAAGQSKTFTAPNSPGTYPYICSIHQYMSGTLVVSS
jgi:plastocyanin